MKTTLICLAAVVAMSGCNAAMYYETEKLSLTLETKADANQPVTGNLGFKQRVVTVVPPKYPDGGDAVSILSAFYLSKAADTTVTIESAFISGNAAVSVADSETKTAKVATALAGTDVPPLDDLTRKGVENVIDQGSANADTRQKLKAIAAKEYAALLPADHAFLESVWLNWNTFDDELKKTRFEALKKRVKEVFP